MAHSNTERRAAPDADRGFDRRFSTVQRGLWVFLALIVAAALFGLLSHGPLSFTTLRDDGARLVVSYETVERRAAASDFRIQTWGESGEVRLRFSPGFLDTYEVRAMAPLPLRASAGATGYEAVFAPAADGTFDLRLHMRARRFGLADITIEAVGRGGVSLRQFIFP
jgi:hypothetical protein